MLHFTFGEPAAFHLTLSELGEIENPYYLFIFERRVPGQTVSFIAQPDESTLRSDAFVIETDVLFAGCDPGQYSYKVYEQESDENLDPANATEVEHGVMQLHPEVNFSYFSRNAAATYKQR